MEISTAMRAMFYQLRDRATMKPETTCQSLVGVYCHQLNRSMLVASLHEAAQEANEGLPEEMTMDGPAITKMMKSSYNRYEDQETLATLASLVPLNRIPSVTSQSSLLMRIGQRPSAMRPSIKTGGIIRDLVHTSLINPGDSRDLRTCPPVTLTIITTREGATA